MKIILLLLISIFAVGTGFAHDDLHKQIALATIEIKAHPDSFMLYLKRGELYYQHEEFDKAVKDFKFCFESQFYSVRLDLAIAKAYFSLEEYDRAITYLDHILATDGKHVMALRWKGHSLMKLQQFSAAGLNFENVISYTDKTCPENYLEASFAWQKSDEPDATEKAISTIKNGIANQGNLLIFHNTLLVIYAGENDFDKAVACQSNIIGLSNRKEFPYFKRAELLIKAGDFSAAKLDLVAARNAIKQLPSSRQGNTAVLELVSQIEKAERLISQNKTER
jgi:tetratricopeptide (TPR) repeat protein